MRNILITGGAGFIGSNVARQLVADGCSVTVLDTLAEQIHGRDPVNESPLFQSLGPAVNFVHGSVTSSHDLTSVLRGHDAVLHLAAETGTGQSMYEIDRYTEVNAGGTAKLLDILANTEHSIRKVVVASSRSIYGEGKYVSASGEPHYPGSRELEDLKAGLFDVRGPGGTKLTAVPTDEESLIHPSSVYGISKHFQESMVMTVCPPLGIAPVALRYQNVYGPGQSLSNPYTGILSIFSTQVRLGNHLNVFEDGAESRDFVYIDDVVAATCMALNEDAANHNVFNVGSGEAIAVSEVARRIIDLLGGQVEARVSGDFRVGDIRHNVADISKIGSVLGFGPTVLFSEGIARFAEWVVTQDIPESRYDQSLAEMRARNLMK